MLKDQMAEEILKKTSSFNTYTGNWLHVGYISQFSDSGIGVECKIGDKCLKSGFVSHRHKHYNCWNTEKDVNKRNIMFVELIVEKLLRDFDVLSYLGFRIEKEK